MTSVLSCQVSMRGNLVRPVPLSAKSTCMQLGPPPFPQVQFFTSSSTHLVTPALQYFRSICTLRGLLSPFSMKCHGRVQFSKHCQRRNCHANLKFGLEVHDKIGYIFPQDRPALLSASVLRPTRMSERLVVYMVSTPPCIGRFKVCDVAHLL